MSCANGSAGSNKALQRFGLLAAADRLVQGYSGGMRKRLELAAATLHGPELLILDEPTAGLDASARHELWDLIRALSAAGVSVLLTTHYLDEADALCQRVAVLDQGRLRALGAPSALKRRYGAYRVRLSYKEGEEVRARLERLLDREVREVGTSLEATLEEPLEATETIRQAIARGELPPPEELELLSPSLDQVFARFTGRAFDPVTGAPLDPGRRGRRHTPFPRFDPL